MKSSTSRSLAPRASCSRICLRRSSARGAFESATVWFWHTRHLSSEARAVTRFSRFCCSSPKTTLEKRRTAAKNQNLLTLELADERQHGLLQDLGRDRADALVAD